MVSSNLGYFYILYHGTFNFNASSNSARNHEDEEESGSVGW